jgi:two-component system, cell cycle sensor histidine kinase and response regulator CckA
VPERETLDTLFRTNETITARLTSTTLISLVVVAGIVALIVLFTFFFSDRITRDLGQLSLAAAKISQKNYDIELAIPSRDELGDLGSAFMQMSREIGNYTEHLEELVAKRTGELEGAFKEISHLNEKLKDENLELSRTFIQASLDGFWTNDFSGQILDVNETLCRMLGYSREELLRMRVQEIEDPEAPEKIGAHIQRIVETGGEQFQTLHRRKEGTLIDVEISAQYVAVLGQRFFVFARDITERKQAEEAQRYHASLVQTVSDAIISTDMAFRVRSWNEAAEKLYGWRAPEVIGKPLSEIVDSEYPSETREAATQAILRDGHWKGELIQRRRNGSPISILGSIELIRDEQGKPTGTVAVNHDITERKRAEREHDRLEAQLRQAQKMESVGRLAGGVAHDFNNMLQVIISYAELALGTLTPSDPLHAAVQEIMKAGRRSADLTRQLLAFARKQAIAPKVLDLNDTAAGMLKMLRRLIGEDIELALIPGHELWKVKMDPSQVDQILANLTVNARDAITGVGQVTIETDNAEFDERYCQDHDGYIPGQYVVTAVSDDGCGMDEETKTKLFEPFFTTKPQGQGTGLGLATVYGIVKQNNGFINVYSEPGKGTTFRVYLPRHTQETASTEEKPAPVDSSSGTETVLLVDDEKAVLEIGTTLLKELGYTVLTAPSPMEAIEAAERYGGELHLLMTDVVMPVMSGRNLCHRIRALRPGIKCLFMSGYTADVIANRGVLDEGIHFLSKPFSKEALALKLREVLDQP